MSLLEINTYLMPEQTPFCQVSGPEVLLFIPEWDRFVLGYGVLHQGVVRFTEGREDWQEGYKWIEPSHWMPLPEKPKL